MKIKEFKLMSGAPRGLCLAVLADLHDAPPAELLSALQTRKPSHVLIPGDAVHKPGHTERGLAFMREVAALFPTFFSFGNHEFKHGLDIRKEIVATGATVLDNGYIKTGGLVIGGLTSGYEGARQSRLKKTPMPDTAWLDGFCAEEGYRILLSHHPEYFDFLKGYDIDLIVSGHAHGGQWQVGNLPIFAPGQGLFPRYCGGFYEDKMFVSRGLANRVIVPRIGNPTELVFLTAE